MAVSRGQGRHKPKTLDLCRLSPGMRSRQYLRRRPRNGGRTSRIERSILFGSIHTNCRPACCSSASPNGLVGSISLVAVRLGRSNLPARLSQKSNNRRRSDFQELRDRMHTQPILLKAHGAGLPPRPSYLGGATQPRLPCRRSKTRSSCSRQGFSPTSQFRVPHSSPRHHPRHP